jgi:hypothetical protein
MTVSRPLVALLASIAASRLSCPQGRHGPPIDAATLIYHLTGCAGRAAASRDFDAVMQLSESAALQPTDGSAIVVLMEAIDAATRSDGGDRRRDRSSALNDAGVPQQPADRPVQT